MENLDKVKLKIVNLILSGLKKITLKVLYYQAKYTASEMVENVIEKQKFDMRGMNSRIKNVLIHDQDVIDKRWSECEKCEFLKPGEKMGKTYDRCTQCGCLMRIEGNHIKTRIATVSCPVGKWGKEYDFIKGQTTNGSQPAVK